MRSFIITCVSFATSPSHFYLHGICCSHTCTYGLITCVSHIDTISPPRVVTQLPKPNMDLSVGPILLGIEAVFLGQVATHVIDFDHLVTITALSGFFPLGHNLNSLVMPMLMRTCLKPRTTCDLLDIATNHASGEEAVGAVFSSGRDKGKAKREDQVKGPRVVLVIE